MVMLLVILAGDSTETHSMDTSLESGPVSTSLAAASLFVSCLPAFKCHLHKELSELSWPWLFLDVYWKKKGTETKKPWLMRAGFLFSIDDSFAAVWWSVRSEGSVWLWGYVPAEAVFPSEL